jgi:hypothetical protein
MKCVSNVALALEAVPQTISLKSGVDKAVTRWLLAAWQKQ